MSDPFPKPNYVLGILGAAAGGFAGYLAFGWIIRQGFYALIIPPAILGLAAGYGVRARSMPFAIGCGIAGLALSLYTEWRYFPFIKDDSFGYFLAHVLSKQSVTLIMILIGTIVSFRLALGMDAKRT